MVGTIVAHVILYRRLLHVVCPVLLRQTSTSTLTRFVYCAGQICRSTNTSQPTNQPFHCTHNTHHHPLHLTCFSSALPTVTTTDPAGAPRPAPRAPFATANSPRDTRLVRTSHELRLFHHHFYSASPDYANHSTRSHSLPLIHRSPCQRHTMSSIITVRSLSNRSTLLQLSILTTSRRC